MKKEYSAPELKKINTEKENNLMEINVNMINTHWFNTILTCVAYANDDAYPEIVRKNKKLFLEFNYSTGARRTKTMDLEIKFGKVIHTCVCGAKFAFSKFDEDGEEKRAAKYKVFCCPNCGAFYNGLGQEVIFVLPTLKRTENEYLVVRDSAEAEESKAYQLVSILNETEFKTLYQANFKKYFQTYKITKENNPELYEQGFIQMLYVIHVARSWTYIGAHDIGAYLIKSNGDVYHYIGKCTDEYWERYNHKDGNGIWPGSVTISITSAKTATTSIEGTEEPGSQKFTKIVIVPTKIQNIKKYQKECFDKAIANYRKSLLQRISK